MKNGEWRRLKNEQVITPECVENPLTWYDAGYEEQELVDVMRDLNVMVIASKDSKLKNVRIMWVSMDRLAAH